MGGMGIDAAFGARVGSKLIALFKYEGTRMPVLSLAYATGILRQAGVEVHVVDAGHQPDDDPALLSQIATLGPDWVIAATSFGFLASELAFLARVHEACGAQRMLVGYAAEHFGDEILARGLAEEIASGDPETAFARLAGSGDVQSSDRYVADLDTLPFPDWQGFPVDDYAYFPLLKRRPFLILQASRGCPYGCRFCPYPVTQGLRFRGRSVDSVVDEMIYLRDRFGAKSLLFRDPTFSFDLDRTKQLAREMTRRRVQVDFGIETRLDCLDEESLDLLAEAGCLSVEFGVDSLDPEVLKAWKRRGFSPEKARGLVNHMESLGMAGAGLFVIGLPEQDVADVERTLDWLLSTDLSYVNVERATPFPGTPLYSESVAKGWTPEITLSDLEHGDPKLRSNGIEEDAGLQALQDRFLRRFYLRPARVARELARGDIGLNVAFVLRCLWRQGRRHLR